MISLTLPPGSRQQLQVLCLGCHADDIEIGCGGTILKLGGERPETLFHWVVFSASATRAEEARRSVARFVAPGQLASLTLADFPDGSMPFHGAAIKAQFEELKRTIAPDLILTHNRHDAHQDHRLIGELTWNTFRDHFILEYEIPKYDGDLGCPSVFVPLPGELCERKIEILLDVFCSQRRRNWFRADTFQALLRLRGMECNAPDGFAEAFYCRKLLL